MSGWFCGECGNVTDSDPERLIYGVRLCNKCLERTGGKWWK